MQSKVGHVTDVVHGLYKTSLNTLHDRGMWLIITVCLLKK